MTISVDQPYGIPYYADQSCFRSYLVKYNHRLARWATCLRTKCKRET